MDSESRLISGTDLQKLRSLKGIKQMTMARSLHISQQAYSKIEHSEKIDKERIKQLLKVLDYTPEELGRLHTMLTTLSSL